MALNKATHLHEILIRFDDAGAELVRAIDVEVVSDGDEVILRRELPPREIGLDELQKLVDEKSASLIAELSKLKNTRDESAGAAAQLGRDLGAAEAEIGRLRGILQQVAATVVTAAEEPAK